MSDREFDIGCLASSIGELIIDFAGGVHQTPITSPLISQLVRAGTSIGANLAEADESDTQKEFLYRMSLARRESKETQHWLRMLARAFPENADAGRDLWKEAEEIKRILSAICRNTRNKPKNDDSRRRS